MAADDRRTADAVEALFAPDPAVAAHPAVRAVRRIARDVLAPHAPAADDPARGVDPAHLDLLAQAGQLAVTVPAEEGGLGGDVRAGIETVERLSGACGATWFVVTQHQMPQAVARGTLGLGDRWTAGPAVERHRAGLSSGRTRAGIAMAHLRRPGPPAVRAEPDGAGWRLSGISDWCTGWGLIDVVMIAGTAPDDRVVLALVPALDAPGLRSGAPLRLSVMGGTTPSPSRWTASRCGPTTCSPSSTGPPGAPLTTRAPPTQCPPRSACCAGSSSRWPRSARSAAAPRPCTPHCTWAATARPCAPGRTACSSTFPPASAPPSASRFAASSPR